MNNTKKLIFTLLAGATLGVAAPVFADSFRDRGYGHDRHSAQFRGYDRHGFREHDRYGYRGHDRYGYRGHDRYGYRGHDRRHVVVERPYFVQRPYIIEQPVYYSQPAPTANYGMGAMIGAAIGGIIDYRQSQ